MQAPTQPRIRWRWLVIAVIAFMVAFVALSFVLLLSLGAGPPGQPQVVSPVTLVAQLVGSAVTVISTLSGLVSIVRFAMDVLHAWRKRKMKQPIPVDKARAT